MVFIRKDGDFSGYVSLLEGMLIMVENGKTIYINIFALETLPPTLPPIFTRVFSKEFQTSP